MNSLASIDRDANRVPIQGNSAFRAVKDVVFDGTANKGAEGIVPLFTVTGDVLVTLVARCVSDLESSGANTATGVAGSSAALIGFQVATDINAGNCLSSAELDAGIAGFGETFFVGNGTDIQQIVADDDITGGEMIFYLLWRPLSADGNVVAA